MNDVSPSGTGWMEAGWNFSPAVCCPCCSQETAKVKLIATNCLSRLQSTCQRRRRRTCADRAAPRLKLDLRRPRHRGGGKSSGSESPRLTANIKTIQVSGKKKKSTRDAIISRRAPPWSGRTLTHNRRKTAGALGDQPGRGCRFSQWGGAPASRSFPNIRVGAAWSVWAAAEDARSYLGMKRQDDKTALIWGEEEKELWLHCCCFAVLNLRIRDHEPNWCVHHHCRVGLQRVAKIEVLACFSERYCGSAGKC